MKRWTPLLTLLTGTGLAAALFTMSAQAAPPATRPAADAGAATAAPAPPAASPEAPTTPGTRPAATSPPATPATPDPAPPTDAPPTVDGNWTGRLDSGATIAITVAGGRASAYVCDGRRLEIWLRGTVTGGKLTLTGKDGARLTGRLDGDTATGEVVLGTRKWTFTATATGGTAPVVYRATAQVRDAGIDGGWIMRPDGTQIGVVTWNGTPVPAPPLDPAFRSTIVNGVGISAEPVVPGPEAGR